MTDGSGVITASPGVLLSKRRDNSARQQQILDVLLETGSATIETLSERFGVSRMTIHRDAHALADQGLIDKLHGSIVLKNRVVTQKTVNFRKSRAPDLKQSIIHRAISMITPEQILVLDDSTTVAAMLPLLPALAPLTIITNAVGVIQALSPYPNLKLICLGGDYNQPRNAFFGLVCEQAAKSLRANTMFLSTSIIHNETAFQNDQDVVKVKQALMQIADQTVLLVDSTKFRKGGLHRLASLNEFDLVLTDSQLKPSIRKSLIQDGINIETCG
ncbi:transcriptional regulator [Gluconobacter thailandicus F149-1 = NBRC 100600]|uniref:DeoR/GlpR transcriptional regulator n=2 Tax=Gluconobacter thailandicus TaxID=257438 RepID=A0AAJ0VIE9_GLUTH|nr:DeoR/GlpR family DNA-binding transcription regulator [Gluconobacter thailandicus]AFW02982.1 transcriptional regulator [Gluconobacter oxydans H24]ANQ41614.1 transcriptional regulator [Gluconobacter oxydans]GAN89952.1 transcriptional regulator [Gluconobacter frateurii M-2]KXV35185.1 transcriptional regulator [Gluconobacter thailandicus]KXV53031.1 transcriptional regulator [Gluconobacter thailandicus]